MSSDVYSKRMKELDAVKADDVQRKFPNLSRPTPIRSGNVEDLAGNLAPAKEEPIEADMDSAFGRSFGEYSGKDVRFDQMMKDYKDLTGVLRQKVERGFMPQVIAERQLKQFLQDGRGYFANNKAKPMDNPQLRNAIEGALSGAMGGGQPQEGQMPQQGGQPMPQGQPMPPQGGM